MTAHGPHLRDPALNKGTAFTEAERDRLGLRGLLPPQVLTRAAAREALGNFRRKPTDLEKYIYLTALHDRNESALLPRGDRPPRRDDADHLHADGRPRVPAVRRTSSSARAASSSPPTTAAASPTMLRNWPQRDVAIIVVTDGERILGLGDLGANGMGIPVGKLSLYTACAGIHPTQCLPVHARRRHQQRGAARRPALPRPAAAARCAAQPYDELVDEFVDRRARGVSRARSIQFEDFANHNAFRAAGEVPRPHLHVQRRHPGHRGGRAGRRCSRRCASPGGALGATQTLLFLGAGRSGDRHRRPDRRGDGRRGSTRPTARGALLVRRLEGPGGRRAAADLPSTSCPYAHDHPPVADLLDAVGRSQPTALIGVAGGRRTFTQAVVEAMARSTQRPIIFALSNPTSKAECTAEQAYGWSGGRALFA